ncbi:MAG: response regulator receiver protein [Gammaproteobacteria bacterium]|nr:response regulator receiver protein [Gammaproteobacteria bacterium]
MLKKLVFVSILSLVCNYVHATDQWHVGGKVDLVFATSNGDLIIVFDKDSVHCTSGENPDYYRVAVGQNGVTAEGANKIYSAALTAGAANKTLDINFDDSSSECYVNRARINFK